LVLLLSAVLSYFLQTHLLSLYAQDTQYSNKNINENNNSSLLNELESIKNILESKVTKLATALQISSSLPQI
jgi:hypothetical protein